MFMFDVVYTKKYICDNCKYSKLVRTTDESYIVCINDNTESSWTDVYDKCKYYEEVNK